MTLKEFKGLLEPKIKEASRVFIAPHEKADFDAIASATGMFDICEFLGKTDNVCIIMDDLPLSMTTGVRSIYMEAVNNHVFIHSSMLDSYLTGNDLLITVDVNKDNLIPKHLVEMLGSFKEIVTLDHHKEDEHTISASLSHIDCETSSASEMVVRLYKLFGITLSKEQATYFLAGISLDTNKFQKNTNKGTLEVAARLCSCGASIQDVNDLFVDDFANDRKVQRFIDHTEFIMHGIQNVAIVCDNSTVYAREELAQAADYLLKYADATYAIGLIDTDTVGISARTKAGLMDIVSVMHEFSGGGNDHSAAAKVTGTSDVELVKENLIKLINRDEFYQDNAELLFEQISQDGEKVKIIS